MKETALAENSFAVGQSNPESRSLAQQGQNNKENVIEGFPCGPARDKEDVKVVNLGVFGNSRKRPAPAEQGQGDGVLLPEDKKMKLNEDR